MKELLYKEVKLCNHPTIYIFPFLTTMLLIPSYPYYVAFIYNCLAIFLVFLYGRENKDTFFSTMLPVRRKDIIKARCIIITLIELLQILLSIPFAILRTIINQNETGNLAGIEANPAFYGFVFIMYGIFNLVFLIIFYKDAFSAGKAFAFAGTIMALYIIVMEVAVQVIPNLKFSLDTTERFLMIKQVPILVCGIIGYILFIWIAYLKSIKNFEKVDL
ncbi:MAG: ABC-2 transporter permease [Lachnospiraceae bacterium]|nr:ABC-2 transporter permease [Lachnospiraceae bacterium]